MLKYSPIFDDFFLYHAEELTSTNRKQIGRGWRVVKGSGYYTH